MEKVVNNFLRCIALVFVVSNVFGQTVPPLERTVTVEINGESSRKALDKIADLAEVNFGYRTDLVSNNDRLTRSYVSKTVRQVLDDLFQGELSYKVKGDYIILKTTPLVKESHLVIEGYVFNAATGNKIPYTSIYDSLNLRAALSDEFGHFSLTLDKSDSIPIIASKYGFRDTLITVYPGGRFYNVYMTPEVDTTLHIQDSFSFTDRLSRLKILRLSEEQKATIQNIREKIKRSFQVSLLPTIGTNGKMSPSTTVDYSFNVLGGLNGGVNVMEIGGIFNADWDTVKHAQVAGAFNFVGGPQYGAQVAGISNFNASSFDGAQVAGFSNFTHGPFIGAQVSGFGNAVVGNVDGAQVAGFANYAGADSRIVQVAPVTNYVNADSKGLQVSAVANVADKNFIGTQITAVANYAMDGFIGSQFSLVNVAGKMTGSQVGFINFNDSIEGAAFGFASFSRKGLHQLEISANELTYLNAVFKTGTNLFYNSFIGGIRFDQNQPTWAAGYGVGTSVRGGGKNRVFFDLQSVNHFRDKSFGLALNNKLTISYQIQIAPKFQIAIGPSANLFLIDHKDAHNIAHFQGLAPYNFSQSVTSGGLEFQTWVGGHIAVRLF